MSGETVPITDSIDTIYSDDALPIQRERWQNLLNQFKSIHGCSPSFVSRSPGRVNLIGEHIDYSLYSVLPMAIEEDVLLAVSAFNPSPSTIPDAESKIELFNTNSERFPPNTLVISSDRLEIDSTLHQWTNYFKSGLNGAATILTEKYGHQFKLKSMKILMDGSVPVGGGLSSSAAFVSASALAVLFANGETLINKTTLTELAIISERAVGVNAGGMDQSASVLSLHGSALFVSFVPTLSAKAVNFPKSDPELIFLVAQSFVQSDKHVTSPVCYNLRVVECSLAAAYLHASVTGKTAYASLLPDSSPLTISLRGFQDIYFSGSLLSYKDQLSEIKELAMSILIEEKGYTREEIAEIIGCSVPELSDRFMSRFPVRAERFMLRQRTLHVYTEASRVLEFLSVLEEQREISGKNGDTPTEEFNQRLGHLMNESQESCRGNYDCSCPEIEEICAIARRAGAYGSRLTGAGWGGCTVHLVPKHMVQEVRMALEKDYYSKRKLTSKQKSDAVIISKPGGGSVVCDMGESQNVDTIGWGL